MNGLKINGNGLANATGKQLLQIIPINIITILAVVGAAVGLYWKFDARISALETSGVSKEIAGRVVSLETKMDNLAPTIIRTDVNVQWLMNKQSPSSPKDGPPK